MRVNPPGNINFRNMRGDNPLVQEFQKLFNDFKHSGDVDKARVLKDFMEKNQSTLVTMVPKSDKDSFIASYNSIKEDLSTTLDMQKDISDLEERMAKDPSLFKDPAMVQLLKTYEGMQRNAIISAMQTFDQSINPILQKL